MQPAEIPVKTDVSHLGMLVGDTNSDRIIAVSTSAVFEDEFLSQTFWGIENTAMDSGFQGHMYTRPNDVLVVRVPLINDTSPQMVVTAISVNHEIWKSLTGIELSSAASRIILASDHSSPPTESLPGNLTWHVGSLLDAATVRYRNSGEAFLAFVLNSRLVEMLELGWPALMGQARVTSLLMDKNNAMQVLQDHGVDCARTYPVNENTNLDRVLHRIPSDSHYIFKPSGGAAGIGVFGNMRCGASLELIRRHIGALKARNQLPRQFQIQKFVWGTPYAATTCFYMDGTFEIFEIHLQTINEAGRFIGGRWNPIIQEKLMKSVSALCQQLSAIKQPPFLGLICLDIINHKVIEINPRLTASAPIAHILRRRDQFSRHMGRDFRIDQIDINTKLNISYESIRNGNLLQLIEVIWKEYGVLVLPQGLNPFGGSRFVFINDDEDETAQRTFIRRICEN